MPGSSGLVMRKRRPPFESAVTQTSARISKSVYDSFVTRKPRALVASMTPSVTRQSALPVTFQLLRSLPLNRFVQLPPACAAAGTCAMKAAATVSAMTTTVVRIVSAHDTRQRARVTNFCGLPTCVTGRPRTHARPVPRVRRGAHWRCSCSVLPRGFDCADDRRFIQPGLALTHACRPVVALDARCRRLRLRAGVCDRRRRLAPARGAADAAGGEARSDRER